MLSFSSLEDNDQFKKIKLPNAAPLRMSLENLIKDRRSIRQYTGDSIPLNYAASIIKAGLGVTSTQEISLGQTATTSLNFRAVPSAGGLPYALRQNSSQNMRETHQAVIGTPTAVAKQIKEIIKLTKVDQILWQIDFGGQRLNSMMNTLSLFVNKVMPLLKTE